MNKPSSLASGVLCALISLTIGTGCATRADLEQVRRSQYQVRRVVADQTVAIEDLRRRLEMLQASLEEGPPDGLTTGELESRLATIERRLGVIPVSPVLPVSLPSAVEDGATIAVGGVVDSAPAQLPQAGSLPENRLPAASVPPAEGANQPTPLPSRVVQPRPVDQGALIATLAREEAELQGIHVDSDYRTALGLIRDGQCKEAIPRLRGFVRKNIKSPFADNAQYWIGRCFHTQGDHNRAIMELYDVLLKFPKSERVPGALLILADAFADSGDDIDARLTLKKLLSDHPEADEVQEAHARLQALGE